MIQSITPAELAQLKPGDPIYAKRFHREGVVVRTNPEKGVAIISVGLFGEVETPASGLALPQHAPARRR